MKMMDGLLYHVSADGGWMMVCEVVAIISFIQSPFPRSTRGACTLLPPAKSLISERERAIYLHPICRYDRISPGTTLAESRREGDRTSKHVVARCNLHPILPLMIAEREIALRTRERERRSHTVHLASLYIIDLLYVAFWTIL
jgi:hypothetical protein